MYSRSAKPSPANEDEGGTVPLPLFPHLGSAFGFLFREIPSYHQVGGLSGQPHFRGLRSGRGQFRNSVFEAVFVYLCLLEFPPPPFLTFSFLGKGGVKNGISELRGSTAP